MNNTDNNHYKLSIGTLEIKEIVGILNTESFQENFTMVN